MQEDRVFSMQELTLAMEKYVFDVLTPTKLGMQRRRKLSIAPEEKLLRLLKDNDELDTSVPFQTIDAVCKNASSDKLLTVETPGGSEILKFRSLIEREAFCRFLQAVSPMIPVVTDAEVLDSVSMFSLTAMYKQRLI